ncbi:MAG TPA: phenylalanine--tRNA ligase subunit beta, partial [Candidatus Dormibacteraeota bacterium]|nr:phenylalanine--tRNA ligase subunit beta [Candidatus Dormibacteraeota bacterium]
VLEEGEPGASLETVLPSDAVLEAEVTSNRPDCLGHLGIARELAAASGRPLKGDFMPLFTGGIEPPGTDLVHVSIEAQDLCRRYIGAAVSGVRVGPSPLWMRRRLQLAGSRPISNVVDISNYVLLEYGQPLHTFDLARLSGSEIRVRRAWDGESLDCLDGVTRQLNGQMLVIADAQRPVALAGVIGGAESAVSPQTRDILLESATFDGTNVRTTSRALALRTEASSRFERGLVPELALAGARRAAQLLTQVAGGSVHRGWAESYPRPQEPVRVRLWPIEIDRRLGVHIPLEEAEASLSRLGFQVQVGEDGAWDVLTPVFRADVGIPEDVIEEVGRIYGGNRIPARLPARPSQARTSFQTERPLDRMAETMIGAGFTETISPALTASSRQEALGLGEGLVRVGNPLSDEMDCLRTSLLPSLLEVAVLNRSQGRREVRIYELARVYSSVPGLGGQPQAPVETLTLATLTSSDDHGRPTLIGLKSVLDRMVKGAGRPAPTYTPAQGTLFHPGRCVRVNIGNAMIGLLGEIHPRSVRDFDLDGRWAGFEVMSELLALPWGGFRVPDLPRYPSAQRDLAVVVAEPALAADLLASITRTGGSLLEQVVAFDEYRGKQIGEGRKSLTFALTFRSPDRTLTDAEVEEVMDEINRELAAGHGAELR